MEEKGRRKDGMNVTDGTVNAFQSSSAENK